MRIFAVLLLLSNAHCLAEPLQPQTMPAATAAGSNPSLVIVVDGLRPDYITREWMPHLYGLGAYGAVGEAHLSVFPSLTRVNAASIATGAYPRRHGLMHNAIYLPAVSNPQVDTTYADPLLIVEEETRGGLLTAPSIGEVLAQAGQKLFVVSSGGSGSAFLLNHKRVGGGILNSRGYADPKSLLQRAEEVVGPRHRRARWVVEAYLEFGLKEIKPDVTLMWLTDPDGAGHVFGLGSPEVREALRQVDDAIGHLLATLEHRGLRDRINIFVTSDHGFSTHGGSFDLARILAQNKLDDGVVIAGGRQIYVPPGDDERIRRIVELLQRTDWVGALFTRGARPGAAAGFVPGTLSLESVHHDHARAADILVDAAWDDRVNEHGFRGATTVMHRPGSRAGHGSSSPYDMRIRLIAAGPDIKRGVRSTVPTSNVDLMATICHLHGVEPPSDMDGRILRELLRNGPEPASIPVKYHTERVSTSWPGGVYNLELHQARVDDSVYMRFTQTSRQ
jgi:predicted AlkP superfamily pyrophosphatase or phosphodiesterase